MNHAGVGTSQDALQLCPERVRLTLRGPRCESGRLSIPNDGGCECCAEGETCGCECHGELVAK